MNNRRLIDLPKEIFKLPWLEKLIANFTYNRKQDHFIARLPPLYKSYPKNSVRKVKRNGISYELDISDYMEWLVFYGIQVEPRNVLYSLIKPGDVVFDVGANIGEVTLNSAKIVGLSGEVHSFEPEPIVFSKISRNLSLNSFSNVNLNNFGLGNVEQQLYLTAQVENNRGGTRVQPGTIDSDRVFISTIDIYTQQNRFAEVNLIKIDVEGYELKVLQGATNTIQQHKPTLFIEIDNDNLLDQGDSARDLVSFLEKNGYNSIVHAETNEKITSSWNFTHCHFDIIAR